MLKRFDLTMGTSAFMTRKKKANVSSATSSATSSFVMVSPVLSALMGQGVSTEPMVYSPCPAAFLSHSAV